MRSRRTSRRCSGKAEPEKNKPENSRQDAKNAKNAKKNNEELRTNRSKSIQPRWHHPMG
jgi:hypothetical protein